jgi:hypothetical protein
MQYAKQHGYTAFFNTKTPSVHKGTKTKSSLEDCPLKMKHPSQIHVKARGDGNQFTELAMGGQTVIVGEGDIVWEDAAP